MNYNIRNICSGVYAIKLKEGEVDGLLQSVNTQPKFEAIEAMNEGVYPFREDIIIDSIKDYTVVKLPLKVDEKIYGLGLQFKNINQRNKVLHLRMDHYSDVDNGRTHVPSPFYVSSKGYGVLINTKKCVTFYVGTANGIDGQNIRNSKDRNTDSSWKAIPDGEYMEASFKSDDFEVIIFNGPTVKEAVARYNLYCGGGFLPPKWALGIWKRVPTLYTDDDVITEIKEFEERGYPIDVVGLEPGWHSKAYPCTFEWDKNRFKDPSGFVGNLLNRDIRVNLWENPYISPHGELFDKILPYCASHNVWCGIVPDVSMKEAIEIYKDHHKKHHIDIGVSGYKIDETDGKDHWLWPDHTLFPSGQTGEELRQVYGNLMQKLTTEMYMEKNQRTYGLIRASNAGAVSFPFAIYNDCYDFDDYLTGLCNTGFIGALWVPEVRGAQNAEEWLRRCQLSALSPVALLNSWDTGTKPWSFEEVQEDIREILNLRKELETYIYNAFSSYCFKGIPPFRAMDMDFNIETQQDINAKVHHTENPYGMADLKNIKDQFMLGECMMVCPIAPSKNGRNVILPNSNWYDFYTGKFVGNGETIIIPADTKRIPIFITDGGIVPINISNDTLELRFYGEKEGVMELYDDDGTTYNYTNGEYNTYSISYNKVEKTRIGCKENYKNFIFVKM